MGETVIFTSTEIERKRKIFPEHEIQELGVDAFKKILTKKMNQKGVRGNKEKKIFVLPAKKIDTENIEIKVEDMNYSLSKIEKNGYQFYLYFMEVTENTEDGSLHFTPIGGMSMEKMNDITNDNSLASETITLDIYRLSRDPLFYLLENRNKKPKVIKGLEIDEEDYCGSIDIFEGSDTIEESKNINDLTVNEVKTWITERFELMKYVWNKNCNATHIECTREMKIRLFRGKSEKEVNVADLNSIRLFLMFVLHGSKAEKKAIKWVVHVEKVLMVKRLEFFGKAAEKRILSCIKYNKLEKKIQQISLTNEREKMALLLFRKHHGSGKKFPNPTVWFKVDSIYCPISASLLECIFDSDGVCIVSYRVIAEEVIPNIYEDTLLDRGTPREKADRFIEMAKDYYPDLLNTGRTIYKSIIETYCQYYNNVAPIIKQDQLPDIEDCVSIEKHVSPLCMTMLNMQLKNACELKYLDRLTYTSYLRGAGYTEVQMVNHLEKWYKKQKAYNETRFKNEIAPIVSRKRQQEDTRFSLTCGYLYGNKIERTGGNIHGCPFKHLDEKELVSLMGVKEETKSNILALKNEKRYKDCCSEYLVNFHDIGDVRKRYSTPVEYLKTALDWSSLSKK